MGRHLSSLMRPSGASHLYVIAFFKPDIEHTGEAGLGRTPVSAMRGRIFSSLFSICMDAIPNSPLESTLHSNSGGRYTATAVAISIPVLRPENYLAVCYAGIR